MNIRGAMIPICLGLACALPESALSAEDGTGGSMTFEERRTLSTRIKQLRELRRSCRSRYPQVFRYLRIP